MKTTPLPIYEGDLIKAYDHPTRNDDYMVGLVTIPRTPGDGRLEAQIIKVIRRGEPVPVEPGQVFRTPLPGDHWEDANPRRDRSGSVLNEPRIVLLKRKFPNREHPDPGAVDEALIDELRSNRAYWSGKVEIARQYGRACDEDDAQCELTEAEQQLYAAVDRYVA